MVFLTKYVFLILYQISLKTVVFLYRRIFNEKLSRVKEQSEITSKVPARILPLTSLLGSHEIKYFVYLLDTVNKITFSII